MNFWIYKGEEMLTVPSINGEQCEGFVYSIHNNDNGRIYIGQKKFWQGKRPKSVKGWQKRKQSKWNDYWGSSDALKRDVLDAGKIHFDRFVEHLCLSQAEMNWFELKMQVDSNVVLDNNYYNNYIGGRISTIQLPRLVKEFNQ